MTGAIEQVSSGASETGKTASRVLTTAQELNDRFNQLRKQMDSFLTTVRSAG